MRDRFGATNPRAQQLRFHTQTAGSTLTAQQPDNNIVRVAMQALAAVMGGTQSLHCNGRDEAMALPTEESAAIALRTQQIIAWESGVANTVDPFGGSYADRGADGSDRARGGGAHRPDRRPRRHAARRSSRASSSGRSRTPPTGRSSASTPARPWWSGVNRYADGRAARATRPAEAPEGRRRIETLQIDPAMEARQIERVRQVRASRDQAAWRAALDAVSAAARGTDNLVPPIIRAVEAHATVGEISDAMRAVFGEHREIDV